jgi:RNA polymerase sigma-70 factor, ECF subfamily
VEGRYAHAVSHDVATLADAALASRIAAAGSRIDSAAETELYRRLAPRVRLYGLRHLRDRHAAHDLMQQVLLMTLERLRAGKLREPERIASFVLGMCRMVVLEIRRGTWRRETLLETYGDTPEAVDAPEPVMLDADKLATCLQALAERERTVVVLTFFGDKPGDEVARELALSTGNVRVIRHRALSRLRACMEGNAA